MRLRIEDLAEENKRLRERLSMFVIAATSVFEDDDEMSFNMLKGALGHAVEALKEVQSHG